MNQKQIEEMKKQMVPEQEVITDLWTKIRADQKKQPSPTFKYIAAGMLLATVAILILPHDIRTSQQPNFSLDAEVNEGVNLPEVAQGLDFSMFFGNIPVTEGMPESEFLDALTNFSYTFYLNGSYQKYELILTDPDFREAILGEKGEFLMDLDNWEVFQPFSQQNQEFLIVIRGEKIYIGREMK